MAEDWKRDRIGAAERGENPTVIARMRSGFAVIGDTQFLPGYCVLLAVPQVEQLNDLPISQRRDFLLDMSLLGDAISRACIPTPRRINYSILGNTDAFLHAHVFPRYDSEPPERIPYPVWFYPRESWTDPQHQFTETRHGALRMRIATELRTLVDAAYAT